MTAHPASSSDTPWTAIVTGGASGIGAATVRKLASRGINVLIADVNAEAGQDLAMTVTKNFQVDATYQKVDVSSEQDIKKMIEAVEQRWGRLDYAVNAAGIWADNAFRTEEKDAPIDLVNRTFEINQRGVWLCQKLEAEQMMKQEPRPVHFSPAASGPLAPQRGAIVNVASAAGLVAQGYPAYTASKHAVVGITKNGCHYYTQHGIRINATAPGGTLTPLVLAAVPEDYREGVLNNEPQFAPKCPLQRNSWPEEQANVISFLLSAEASYVSGAILEVDGGYVSTRM